MYFLMEVGWKTCRGHPESISWTMLVVAMLLCVPIERAGEQLSWECPLLLQAFACAALVTIVELFAGLVLNVWLGLGVWDYSHLPLNLWGQICPQFSALWFALCLVFIPMFDWLKYAVLGRERPSYRLNPLKGVILK